jgi:hypothetical protein
MLQEREWVLQREPQFAMPATRCSAYRKSCQVPHSKIFRFTGILIYGINPAVPRPHEGRFAIVTMRWAQDAMDAAISGVALDFRKGSRPAAGRRSAAYGEVVWSWRRDRGVKSAEDIPPATVARNAAHRGEHV